MFDGMSVGCSQADWSGPFMVLLVNVLVEQREVEESKEIFATQVISKYYC